MARQPNRTGWALRAAAIVGCLVCAIFGYGYWHSVTHASFHASLDFKAEPGEKSQVMPKATVTFLDGAGKMLAQGIADDNYGYVHLLHPQVGDCHEVEEAATTSSAGRNAWQECFAQLSTWIPKWARDVRQVDVVYNGIRFEGIPLTIAEYNSEWLLWWVPLPHVGGKPYTYFRTTITVEGTAQARPQ